MKSVFIGFLSLILLAMVSCNRDYYCKCTYSYSGVGAPPPTVEIISISGGKSYAESTCEERNGVFVNSSDDSTVVVCDLN